MPFTPARRPRGSSSSSDHCPTPKAVKLDNPSPNTDQLSKLPKPSPVHRKPGQSASGVIVNMEALMERFDALEVSNAEIKQTVNNSAIAIHETQNEVRGISNQIGDITQGVESVREENKQLRHELAILKNKHYRLEATVNKLAECVTDIQGR